MTPDGLKVMDSDMHVLEPPDLWQRYIDPAFRHVAPVGLAEMPRGDLALMQEKRDEILALLDTFA